MEEMPSALGFLRESELPYRLQFKDELLEPQLVRLVYDDEEQLIVSGRIGQETLGAENLIEPEVAGVREPAVFLAEPRGATLGRD